MTYTHKKHHTLLASTLAIAMGLGSTALWADGHGADMKKEMMSKFMEADTNGDSVVDHGEFMARMKDRFAQFDQNGDGTIVLDELPAMMPTPEHMKARAKKYKKKLKDKKKDLSPEQKAKLKAHMKKYQGMTRIEYMARHDWDKNEQISMEEFSAKGVKHFKKADKNGDGAVTMAELKKAYRHHHKKHKKHKSGKGEGETHM